MDDPVLSTTISGTGGTAKDYGEIRLVIELSTGAIRDNDPVALRETLCEGKRGQIRGELDNEFSNDTFGEVIVSSVSGIKVTGERAAAHVVIETGGDEFPQEVSLVRENGEWLMC